MNTKDSLHHSINEISQSRGHPHNHVVFFDESSMNNLQLEMNEAIQHSTPIMFFDELSTTSIQLKRIQSAQHSIPFTMVTGDFHQIPG